MPGSRFSGFLGSAAYYLTTWTSGLFWPLSNMPSVGKGLRLLLWPADSNSKSCIWVLFAEDFLDSYLVMPPEY